MFENILKDYESFRESLVREGYLIGAGLKEKPEYEKIFSNYSHLFDLKTVADVIRGKSLLPEDAPFEDFEAFDKILFALLNGYIFLKLANLYAEMQSVELSREVDGIPFRMINNVLEKEEDREKRRKLSEGAKPIIEELTQYKLRIARETLNIARKEFGYSNLLSYWSASLMEDVAGYSMKLEEFLRSTEEDYNTLAEEIFESYLGLKWGEVENFDVPFLMSGIKFSDFRVDDPIGILRKTLDLMGLNLDEFKNLRIDHEFRPKKSPRAFCAPIRVPDEVVVVFKPSGSFNDISVLFHEMGHALHFTNTDRNLPEVHKIMGRSGTSEVFAFNFQYIADSEGWVKEFFGKNGEFLRYRKFAYLYLRRRYAAKVIYEAKLFSSENWEEIGPKLYSEILTSATGVFHPPYNYFWDLDFGFYSVDYSQAWEAEKILREYLKREFGEDWYFNRQSGEFLKELWKTGLKYPPLKLVSKLRP